MDETYNGETLNATGWASGTNDRTKQWGNFSANYVYVVPVVYVQPAAAPQPVGNKPAPRLFRPPSPEEPVSITKIYSNTKVQYLKRLSSPFCACACFVYIFVSNNRKFN
jgi:hypothetical protein